MRFSRTRSFGAVFLSAWLGFLACLMGCTPAAFASPRDNASCPPDAIAHKSGVPSGGCCQHHGKSPAPDNHAPQKQSPYCCPVDATFQKQTQSPQLAILFVALGPAVAAVFTQPPAFAPLRSDPHPLHSGRDILLQSRILRI